jgi:hypothetical protein
MMINGRRSTYFYSSILERMLGRKQNAASSWKQFCGFCAAARSDACFWKTRETGTQSTNGLRGGANTVCGKICISTLPMIRIWSKSYSTVPLCERILARQGRKKSGGQENQALGRSRGGSAPRSTPA